MIFVFFLFTILALIACLVVAWDKIVAGKVPFVGLHSKVLDQIVPELNILPEDVFLDLGCGDGKVLIRANKAQPLATYIGVERAIVPYLIAKWRCRNHSNISIWFGNMLSKEYKGVTVVFAYLLPELLSIALDVVYTSASPRKIVVVEYASPKHLAGKKHILAKPTHLVRQWYELDL